MKTSILFIIILVNIICNAQVYEPPAYQKNTIIANLDSTTRHKKLNAILDVYDMYVPEAIPKIELDIFKQQQDIAHWYLICLEKYNSPNFINIAHRYIDTVASLSYTFEPENIDQQKVDAIVMLMHKRDYSRVGFLFEYIERLKPAIASTPFNVLHLIVENVPEYAEQAKAEFRRIALSSNDDNYGPVALLFTSDYYGDELIPDLVYIMQNSTSSTKKNIAYDKLKERNYLEMESLTKSQFLSDPVFSEDMLIEIIMKYNNPSNYKFLLDNFENVLQPDEVTFYTEFFNSTKLNYPLHPQSYALLTDQIIYVIGLCDSLTSYSWLGNLTFSNELKNILTTAKTNLQNSDSIACRVQVKAFQDLVDNVYKDSLNSDARFVTIEGWKFLYWNAQYILDRLPEPATNPNLVVNLKNSLGNQIPASNVKYYEGSWKDAVNNGDGTFTVITTRATVSIRVFYEYASQQVDNVTAQNNTYTFTTVNAAVQLKNSLGNLIDIGTVQYYAGAWRSFGTTSNGVVYKELLPINYSFRMTYEYGSIDKQQNLSVDPIVVFQTVNAEVQLKNSLGSFIDVGTVQYYAGAWRNFGATSNGVAYKELLPVNYSFRMTYEYVSKDKQQNLGTNPVVDFSTVLCSVKVSKTNNQPLNNAAVKYYAGAWRNLGTTNTSGIATKELLPANISFRANFGNVTLDKQQDISANSLVEIILNIP